MEVHVDSLKVSGITAGLGLVYWIDILSAVLMCVMFGVNIIFLLYKIKNIRS